MELTNEFRVPAPIDRTWELITDVERIAPCLPGAELTEVDGEKYRGTVKVKVGPITARYKGNAHFVELDHEKHLAVLLAQGRETRGQGNASATVTAQLEADGDGTRVAVVTDLTITGRVAQFGRGVLADVSDKLLAQFAADLEKLLTAGDGTNPTGEHPDPSVERPGSSSPTATDRPDGDPGGSGQGPKRPGQGQEQSPPPAADHDAGHHKPGKQQRPAAQRRPAEPIDLLEVAGAPTARRLVPLVAGAAGAAVFLWLLLRHRRRS